MKKDNFFIAIDLHPSENNLKFIADGLIDAVATKDHRNMGKHCVLELANQLKGTTSQQQFFNCGSIVHVTADISEIYTQ